MHTVVLACETLRPELELLTAELPNPPETRYLEQGLHSYPDRLRAAFLAAVAEFEAKIPGPLTIICGYGLCGRALSGVYARRAILVFPRLHDCIALLRGLKPHENKASSQEGRTYWISPGFLKYFMIPRHLGTDGRLAMFEKKYGPARAARLLAAENALYKNYTQACHIRWAEMREAYVPDARKVAESVSLPYTEVTGSSWYMAELLAGGENPEYFLRLQPGQTIDMDVDGGIHAVPLASGSNI